MRPDHGHSTGGRSFTDRDARSVSARRRRLLAGVWTDGRHPDPGSLPGVVEIDGSGATIVPGMVDSHAHLALPGGAGWTSRGFDPLDTLLAVGEENGELMVRAGIRWGRDVGAPRRAIPVAAGTEREASLVPRERWLERSRGRQTASATARG